MQNAQGDVLAGQLETCMSVLTWHVIHVLHTSSVKTEWMKFYN